QVESRRLRRRVAHTGAWSAAVAARPRALARLLGVDGPRVGLVGEQLRLPRATDEQGARRAPLAAGRDVRSGDSGAMKRRVHLRYEPLWQHPCVKVNPTASSSVGGGTFSEKLTEITCKTCLRF